MQVCHFTNSIDSGQLFLLLIELENVILASHNIAWTRELCCDIGAMASQNLIDLANGKQPKSVVNPEVFDRPSSYKKWESVRIGQLNPQSG